MKTSLKAKIILLITLCNFVVIQSTYAQHDTTQNLTLLFIGDIMGHDSQINSAMQPDGTYNYNPVFKYIKPVIDSADIAIANLEVTLAGPPFKGYPAFSSPDALAFACKNAGIDIMGTANNHCIDRGKAGLLRTIKILDSIGIQHTGTYTNYNEKNNNNPFIINKNGFKIALINYTYGTNGIPVPNGTVVNIINHDSIANDIEKAKQTKPHLIIMYIHWGNEYQTQPDKIQNEMSQFCFNKGADIIIGSHPHVIQKSSFFTDTINNKQRFVTYSLGNFISNQRKPNTDGGQMIKLTLNLKNDTAQILECGHILTWVYTPTIMSKKYFYILPCAQFELMPEFFEHDNSFDIMRTFISSSRNLLNTYNTNVREYLYYNNLWGF